MRGREEPDLRDRVEYAGLSLLLGAFRLLPRPASRSLGRAAGKLAGSAVRLRREVALDNLRRALPDRTENERRRILDGMYRNLGVVAADFARMTALDREGIRSVMCLESDEPVAAAHRAGRGGLLLGAHFGNWEAMGASLAARGFPITALGARQRNPLVERLFSRYRERIGMGAITIRQGMRPLVRVLREGRLVATLADQDGGRDGFFLPFFGREASVQPGLFRLAARMRIPIVIGLSVLEEGAWRGVIDPPVFPQEAAGEDALEAEARRLAAHYTRRVEEAVRERPDHWFWVHRRWRTRPPGEA